MGIDEIMPLNVCVIGNSILTESEVVTKQSLGVSSSEGVFLGYIGDAPLTWTKIEQPDANGFVALNSFSLAKPSGANITPEPDSQRMVIVGTCVSFVTFIWKPRRLRFYRWTPSKNNEKVA